MKKLLLLIALITVMVSGCKKETTDASSKKCMQCVMIVQDSAGTVLETQTGSPDPSAMHYCDDVLTIVLAQKPVWINGKKYHYSCQ